MTPEQIENVCFYCWQLDIKTTGQLAQFKDQHHAKTNEELLTALFKTYNS